MFNNFTTEDASEILQKHFNVFVLLFTDVSVMEGICVASINLSQLNRKIQNSISSLLCCYPQCVEDVKEQQGRVYLLLGARWEYHALQLVFHWFLWNQYFIEFFGIIHRLCFRSQHKHNHKNSAYFVWNVCLCQKDICQ